MKRPLVFALPILLSSCGLLTLNSPVLSQKYIHKYGFELDETEWIARDRDGKIEQQLHSGVQVVKSYEGGALHGKTTYTYPYSTTIEKSLLYDQGDLVKETVHDRRGIPIQQKSYLSDREKMITYWSPSGAPLRVEIYRNNKLLEGLYYNAENKLEAKVKNGHGIRYKRLRDGSLMGVDEIAKGSLVKRTSYHPNQKVHVVSHFQDYLLHGTQEIYTPKGNLYMRNEWQNGLLHGKKLAYREGNLLIATNYERGKREGIEKRYDTEGKLLSELAFQDDEMHGLSTYYGARNSNKKEWFYRGKPISAERFRMLTSKDDLLAKAEE